MKIENRVVSFYAQIHDVNAPERGFGYHVNYVEVKTYDDGEVVISGERQCNAARALELGLDLGPSLAALNLTAQAVAEESHQRAEKAEEAVAEKQAEVDRNQALALEAIRQRDLALATVSAAQVVAEVSAEAAVGAPAAEEKSESLISKLTLGLFG